MVSSSICLACYHFTRLAVDDLLLRQTGRLPARRQHDALHVRLARLEGVLLSHQLHGRPPDVLLHHHLLLLHARQSLRLLQPSLLPRPIAAAALSHVRVLVQVVLAPARDHLAAAGADRTLAVRALEPVLSSLVLVRDRKSALHALQALRVEGVRSPVDVSRHDQVANDQVHALSALRQAA